MVIFTIFLTFFANLSGNSPDPWDRGFTLPGPAGRIGPGSRPWRRRAGQTENSSHRPVGRVSHAAPGNVAYHSLACVNKGRSVREFKEYGEK